MKHIIWSNMNLQVDDWRDGYREYLEANDLEGDPDDDYEVSDWMIRENNNYLDDERMNLNKQLDGRVLIIADLGLWNGRKQGYKIGTYNLNSIFDIGSFDYAEFYTENRNVKAREHHHDGTNYYTIRVIREDKNVQNLLDAIYRGDEISRSMLNYYTKSLYNNVAEVYGWKGY